MNSIRGVASAEGENALGMLRMPFLKEDGENEKYEAPVDCFAGLYVLWERFWERLHPQKEPVEQEAFSSENHMQLKDAKQSVLLRKAWRRGIEISCSREFSTVVESQKTLHKCMDKIL